MMEAPKTYSFKISLDLGVESTCETNFHTYNWQLKSWKMISKCCELFQLNYVFLKFNYRLCCSWISFGVLVFPLCLIKVHFGHLVFIYKIGLGCKIGNGCLQYPSQVDLEFERPTNGQWTGGTSDDELSIRTHLWSTVCVKSRSAFAARTGRNRS